MFPLLLKPVVSIWGPLQDWEHREHLGIDSPVAPFQERPLAFAKALPPECAKAARHHERQVPQRGPGAGEEK
jgi:hypothetical protein